MEDIELIRAKIKNKTLKKENIFKKIKLNRIFSKILISTILFLGMCITAKTSSEGKEFLYKTIYENNFSFAYINTVYEKYFGKILPVGKIFKEELTPVFKEELVYSNKENYNDGVKLTVTKNYLIPVIESGMVVFIGEKENYGNTIIVQQINGIDVWYGNVANTDIKLYEYIEKGSLLGESKEDILYLLFKKDGNVIDYNEYIK